MVTREQPFDVVAADEPTAVSEAAALQGIVASELQVISTEALSHMPWQPKKFRFTLVRRPPPVESHDGHWTVDYRLGKVWLTVYPPQGQGCPVMPEDLLTARRGWPATATFDHDRLYAVVEKAPGQPVDVATFEMPKTPGFVGLISANDMAAYLVVGAKGNPEGRLDAARAALANAGVTFGIDDGALEAAIAHGAPGEAFLVAQGRDPEVGQDAVLLAGTSLAAPLIRPDGTLDFTASRLDEPLAVGEALLAVQLGNAGAEGQSVRGAVIPTSFGKEFDLESFRGDGVAVSPDGTQLVATVAGTPRRLADRVSVLPLLRFTTNVDSTTGNIDFDGNLVIDGEVLDGVSVRAAGDILVKGGVKGAQLEAGGSVLLRQGVLGGEVHSRGDFQAELLRDCTVTAAGDVRVSHEIARATVTAGNDVVAGQATVIGGTITARHEILARVVGTAQGTMTKLILEPTAGRTLDSDAAGTGPTYLPGHARPSVRVHDRIFAPAQISMGVMKFLVERETPFCKFMEDHGNIVVASFA